MNAPDARTVARRAIARELLMIGRALLVSGTDGDVPWEQFERVARLAEECGFDEAVMFCRAMTAWRRYRDDPVRRARWRCLAVVLTEILQGEVSEDRSGADRLQPATSPMPPRPGAAAMQGPAATSPATES